MSEELAVNSNESGLEESAREYVEEDDEDFVPDQNMDGKHTNNNGSSSEDADDDEDNVYEDGDIRSKDYSKIESDTGGLIKTRRGRQLEQEHLAKHKYDNLMVKDTELSSKVTDTWIQLQQESDKRLNDGYVARLSVISDKDPGLSESVETNLPKEEEQILIERTYKFAGETIREKKWVPKSSAMAQEYLNSLKFEANKMKDKEGKSTNGEKHHDDIKEQQDDSKPQLRRPLKRPPMLEDIISGSLKPKLSTLEKSKLDWVQYVDKEGISEELQYNKKGGYLAKQDFLSRVESRQDDKYKALRQKQLAMQFQAQQQQGK